MDAMLPDDVRLACLRSLGAMLRVQAALEEGVTGDLEDAHLEAMQLQNDSAVRVDQVLRWIGE